MENDYIFSASNCKFTMKVSARQSWAQGKCTKCGSPNHRPEPYPTGPAFRREKNRCRLRRRRRGWENCFHYSRRSQPAGRGPEAARHEDKSHQRPRPDRHEKARTDHRPGRLAEGWDRLHGHCRRLVLVACVLHSLPHPDRSRHGRGQKRHAIAAEHRLIAEPGRPWQAARPGRHLFRYCTD